MASRRRHASGGDLQPGLALVGEGFDLPSETNGIFSTSYLSRHLPETGDFASVGDVEATYSLVRSLIADSLTALGRRGEAFTCSRFLEPILDALGWRRLPQEAMPTGGFGTRKTPDYCLFASDADYSLAAQADATALFSMSATVLEAKKWNHPLDRLSETDTPGWFPSEQIQDYLNHAKDSTGRRFFNWAILTNGCEWRLYTDNSAAGAYYAFHLARLGQICDFESFRLFFTLFRAAAFERDGEGLCFLDSAREQSLRVQTELETNLRKRVFGILEDLGTAFVDWEPNGIAEGEYPAVYQSSLIFLYRLLFILYAESRDLLPVRLSGAGASRRYRLDFSLARLTDRLRSRSHYTDNAFYTLYEDLLKLFNLINGTHPRQNRALGVTRYNGGLFNPALHPRLATWRIGDIDLANILRQLVFAQPPARAGDRQGVFSTNETIDYSTLEVRQLGDIYEGLLGAHFERVGNRLELRNENDENHRHGIFYTPDWIVRFLVRETLNPLLDRIEASADVRRAMEASSEERRRDNSFALAVLNLNLVDPAMGSGHFLVRATEWLADKIMAHPTTRRMTRQVVGSGDRPVTREDILGEGRVPVSPGVPQERAEKAYWRRRVVEACIHGVDINPMAVELAKLSLWLTCIAVDEPLNFLDHHLRYGNALLFADPEELKRSPSAEENDPGAFDLGESLESVLADTIRENVRIEGEPSFEMEVVKAKEDGWKRARERLRPFLDLADLWIATLDGISLDSFGYLSVAKLLVKPGALSRKDTREVQRLHRSLKAEVEGRVRALHPFHWQIEFPDLFFDEDGRALPADDRGFDAILGNPPYVSVHTAREEGNRSMRNALERRAGYVEDLYVHFTDLGFRLLKRTGRFGFIVSDTFFTLASKLRMRDLLQRHALDWLGQCDPFDATVDAAVFVAEKSPPAAGHRFRFVQARPLRRCDGDRTRPEVALDRVPEASRISWNEPPSSSLNGIVRHAIDNEIRVHDLPLAIPLEAHKCAFFEPRPGTLRLFDRFNGPVKRLVEQWWEKIADSRAFAENIAEIRDYHRSLRAGDITLVGLIAEGGQGMRTANNARFLAYLEGASQAGEIERRSAGWTAQWRSDVRISGVFDDLIRRHGGDPDHPLANRAAWEAAVLDLRGQFPPGRLGFGRTALYRIAPRGLIAGPEDFAFSLRQRKAELLAHWRDRPELRGFWYASLDLGEAPSRRAEWRSAETLDDAGFCALCQSLKAWVARENTDRPPGRTISREALGLRSSEEYADPADAPRIAVVYNGLYGRARFVPFRKGDPTGNRWIDNEPLFCDWTHDSVVWLSSSPEARWQGHKFFLRAGVTWSLHANHVPAKCRYQEPCVFDASSSRLTPVIETLSAPAFLAIANSAVFSFVLKKFLKHNQDIEINDMRMMPIPIPDVIGRASLSDLAELAMAAKRHEFARTPPPDTLVARVREIGDALRVGAPEYLRPGAQGLLLARPDDCLEIVEKAVNWEAEKLYGVEGEGPFDEF